ncbi:MAG TPA: ABC transporter ATP-binding protein [Candidatus Paceibacterota bacterium]|nr:ABC transporter ATP-binding protein [Candidatus Paceibacterota bacterium]
MNAVRIVFIQLKRVREHLLDKFPLFRLMALFGALTLLVKLLDFAVPYLIGRMEVGFGNRSWLDVSLCIATIAAVYVTGMALNSIVLWNAACRYILIPISKMGKLRSLERASSLSLARAFDMAVETGEVVENGLSKIDSALSMVIFRIMKTAAAILVAAIGLSLLNGWLSAIATAGIVLFLAASVWVNLRFLPWIREDTREWGKVDSSFRARIRNMGLVILMNQQGKEILGYGQSHERRSESSRLLWKRYLAWMVLVQSVISAACFIGIMAVSAKLVLAGQMSMGRFFAAIWWTWAVFASIESMTSLQRDLMESWGPIEKHLDFLAGDQQPLDSKVGLHTPDRFEEIWFDHVYYGYPDPKNPLRPVTWALEDVDFRIRRGEFVALVGPSGSGKSTAFNLLLGGDLDTPARVMVNGIPVKRVDPHWWWGQIGYVPQGQKLKLWGHMSVVENILYGRVGIPRQRLEEVMKAARLYEDFWGDGGDRARMHQPVGENGCRLSGGERQRVAIARALIGSPSVLLFDEATSGLDNESEALILFSILDLASQRDADGRKKYTVIVIAHRLVTASKADRVIVLEKGRLAGQGSHLELLDGCKLYAKLALLESFSSRLQDVTSEAEEPPAGQDSGTKSPVAEAAAA